MVQNNDETSDDIAIEAPLKSHQIIKHMDAIKKDNTYLVLYIDSINFEEEKFTIGAPDNSHQ